MYYTEFFKRKFPNNLVWYRSFLLFRKTSNPYIVCVIEVKFIIKLITYIYTILTIQ